MTLEYKTRYVVIYRKFFVLKSSDSRLVEPRQMRYYTAICVFDIKINAHVAQKWENQAGL